MSLRVTSSNGSKRQRMTRLYLAVASLVSAMLLLSAAPALGAGLYPALTTPTLVPSLGEPTDMALALDGELFVADGANGRVAVMVGGVVVRDWDGSGGPGPELERPAGIAIGPDANVYVADSELDQVLVYQRNGTFVRAIGTTGSTDGRLLGPCDVVVDAAGSVWVADTFNDRVQKFSSAGAWIKTLGAAVPGTPTFMQPFSLDLYGSLVYVTEATGLRGQAFNATTYAAAILPWGITDGGGGAPTSSRYLRPAGIDVDASARLFVADGGRGVIEQLNSAASVVTTLSLGGPAGGLSQPAGVLSTASHLLVADSMNDRIARYGFGAAAWDAAWRPGGSTAPGAFMAPAAIAPLSDGGFVVADTGADRVQRFSASGSFVGAFDTTGLGAVDAPWGVVVSAGEVFVADSGNARIQVFDEAGAHVRTLGGPGGGDGQFSSPTALAIDPDGNLLVADTGNDRVQRITTAGAHLQTLASAAVTAPRGVAADASGTVYVADTGAHRVRAFSAAGDLLRTWGVFGPANGQLSSPQGLAVDPVTGEVLVADTGNHRVQAFSAMGVFASVVGARGTSAGELRAPASVAIAPSRGLLVADTGNHRVQRLAYDATPPVTTASGIPMSWVNAAVTVTLTATDTGSGVATTYYRLGTGADTVYTGPFTVSTQGTTALRFWSVDRTGNIESPAGSGTIRIDSVPPSGTMVVASGASIVGTRTVSVESTVTDAVSMSIDAGSGFGPRMSYSKNATVTVPAEGVRTVTVRYYDVLDNLLTLSDQVTVDITAPAVTLTRAPASATTSLPVTVTLTATDAVAGVAQRLVRVSPAAEQPYTAPLTFDTEGTYQVTARAIDAVGNTGSAATTVTIDRTGPVTTLAGITDGQLFSAPAVFSLAATDPVSGVSAIRYTLDATAEKTYTTPVTVSADGTHTLSFTSIDTAGNRRAPQSLTFVVDRTAPTVSASGVAPGAYLPGDALVTITAADAVSGVADVRYSVDGGDFATYTGPVPVAGDGAHTIEYDAIDTAGNRSALGSLSFTIDSRVPAGDLIAEDGRAWVAREEIALSNLISGASDMRFDIGSGFGAWMPYAAGHAVTFPGEGSYRVVGEYRSLAGLVGTASVDIGVDVTPPSVTAIGALPDSYRASDTTITLAVADALSGVAVTRYRVDGGEFAEYTGPFLVAGEAYHVVEFEAVDVAGNTSELGSLAFTIDSRVPVGQLIAEDGSLFVNRTDVRLQAPVTGAVEMRYDAGAGFGEWLPYESHHTVTVPGEGLHTIVGEYRSLSGLTTQLPVTITVDITSPQTTPVRMTPTALHIVGTTVRTWVTGRWTAEDPGDSASGIVSHRASVGVRTYPIAGPEVKLSGMRAGTHALRVGAGDRAGNQSADTIATIRLGALSAPTVTTGATPARRRFTSLGAAPAPGETARFRCFRRDVTGVWRLERTIAARAVSTRFGPALTGDGSLGRGTWRVAVEVSSDDGMALGTPCAAFTVR